MIQICSERSPTALVKRCFGEQMVVCFAGEGGGGFWVLDWSLWIYGISEGGLLSRLTILMCYREEIQIVRFVFRGGGGGRGLVNG